MNKDNKIKILDQSNERLKSIVLECKNKKFNNLHSWAKFQSISFKEENENHSPRFKRYRRGTIVFVNFGIGIGAELSGNHFAIVLNKNDSPLRGTLTVLPLTSKEKKYNLPFSNELICHVFENLVSQSSELTTFSQKICDNLLNENGKIIPDNIVFINDKSVLDFISNHSKKNPDDNGIINFKLEEIIEMINENIKSINEVVDYYEKYNKPSFGMIDSITTVSKYRIRKPINDVDPIGKITVSNQTLNIIDESIIEKFTLNKENE